jgi:hypothetical protein
MTMENATIYSTKTGDTISAGLQSGIVCDEAINTARRIARERNETVILDDPEDGGEFLVGPRGGVRTWTAKMKRKMGF